VESLSARLVSHSVPPLSLSFCFCLSPSLPLSLSLTLNPQPSTLNLQPPMSTQVAIRFEQLDPFPPADSNGAKGAEVPCLSRLWGPSGPLEKLHARQHKFLSIIGFLPWRHSQGQQCVTSSPDIRAGSVFKAHRLLCH